MTIHQTIHQESNFSAHYGYNCHIRHPYDFAKDIVIFNKN